MATARKAVRSPQGKKAARKAVKKTTKNAVRKTATTTSKGTPKAAGTAARKTVKKATAGKVAKKTAARKTATKKTATKKTARKTNAQRDDVLKATGTRVAGKTGRKAVKKAAGGASREPVAKARKKTAGKASTTTRKTAVRKQAAKKITPARALANARALLEQKQEHDRQPAHWQQLDDNDHAAVPGAGFASPEAAGKAQELHAAESRMKAIQGSLGTQDRRNQGKRDHRGE